MAHAGGRPLKYGTPEELQKRITAYFDSLWEEDWRMIFDKEKNPTGAWFQVKDREGNPMMKLKELPTVTGLAMYLETSRETLMNYQGRDDFFEIVKRAKDLCEYWAEKSATEGTCNYALGIFKLKNFGWVDKIEINNTSDGEKLSDNDIKSRLDEIKGKSKVKEEGK
jgi:hypothetical protein